MNWTELLSSPAAAALYGFLGNTLVTYVLRNVATRNVVIVVLKAIVGALEKAAPVAALLLILMASGCSLEAARTARINSQLAARSAPLQARPAAECRAWDTIHVWGDWSAGGLGAIGAGAGVVAAASTEGKTRDAMIWTGVGAAALSAVAIGWAEKSASTWQEQCSQ